MTVHGGEADGNGGAVGEAGERERIVFALRDRHGAAGGENVGGIIVKNVVKRAVLVGDKGDRGGILRGALDAVFLDRDGGTRRVAHGLAAHDRPHADGVRPDGADLEGVDAVVFHHGGEIDRSFGDLLHGNGLAVGFASAIELYKVLGRVFHAGPCRHLLAVLFLPEGIGRRAERRGNGSLRHRLSGFVAEAVSGGNVHGMRAGVELLERDRILAANELGLACFILQNVRRVVELVVVCTGFRGGKGDGRFVLRGARGGDDFQHGRLAVIKEKLFHVRGGSGGKLFFRGGCAADVERGAVEHLAECERVVLIGGNGADAALNRAGGDPDLAGGAGQIDAVCRLDPAERIHADLYAGSADNGFHAGSAAGNAHLAQNVHGGVLRDDDAGGIIRHLDDTGALERETSALHMENGGVGITLALGKRERDRLSGQLKRYIRTDCKRPGKDDLLRRAGLIQNIGTCFGDLRNIGDHGGAAVCQRRHGQQRYCHQHGEQKGHQFLCHNKVTSLRTARRIVLPFAF